ncbi:hypothetical protein BN946_scf185015.g150 [Trametes cinnabarina]|uniref:Uncharacterized protein n=1 Tax=Pycnoporus cinnabarinus TaxID=5643 RepID=A0A060SI41_PYCCI|nr:hypothetical protein BN946_scf185015.g150 [Trametes cinnabarina]
MLFNLKTIAFAAVTLLFAGQAAASALIATDPVSACNCPNNCSHEAGSDCKFKAGPSTSSSTVDGLHRLINHCLSVYSGPILLGDHWPGKCHHAQFKLSTHCTDIVGHNVVSDSFHHYNAAGTAVVDFSGIMIHINIGVVDSAAALWLHTMSSMTIDSEDRISRIHRIELRDPDLSASPRIVRTTAEGHDGLAAPGRGQRRRVPDLLYVPGMIDITRLLQFDVINSTHFAQLAANIRYDRQNDAAGWYKCYESTLKDLGWTLSRKFKLAKVNDSDETSAGSVDRLLLRLAQNHLTGGEHALFHSMIDALKHTPNEMAVKRFDSSATGKSSKNANFQVGVVSAEGRNASFKIGAYALEASQSIDKVLFLDMGSQNVSIHADSQTMILNEDAYSRVRQTVLDRLGQAAYQIIVVQL